MAASLERHERCEVVVPTSASKDKRALTPSLGHVRYAPESGQIADMSECPLSANSVLTRCSTAPHSITSSAMAKR